MKANGIGATDTLLRIRGLSKTYVRRDSWWRRTSVEAVRDIDLEVARNTILAIVGESGSGKSTLARCLARLEQPDRGGIWLDGVDIATLFGAPLRQLRPKIQMVFQEASAALNPQFSAAEVVAEPLLVQGWGNVKSRLEVACELMKQVGLSPDWAARPAPQFSGGQRQRLALARAIALKPKLLVLDEAFTGLDLSTQAQIANLLLELREQHSLTYVLISHDIGLAAKFAEGIAVMSAGRIVERGAVDEVVRAPQHERTRALLAAAELLNIGFAGTGIRA